MELLWVASAVLLLVVAPVVILLLTRLVRQVNKINRQADDVLSTRAVSRPAWRRCRSWSGPRSWSPWREAASAATPRPCWKWSRPDGRPHRAR